MAHLRLERVRGSMVARYMLHDPKSPIPREFWYYGIPGPITPNPEPRVMQISSIHIIMQWICSVLSTSQVQIFSFLQSRRAPI